METIYGTMKDLHDYVRNGNFPKFSILLRSLKTGLPLGAYASDGRSGGEIWSRKRVRAGALGPSHLYGSSDAAFRILKSSVESDAS